MHHHLESCNAQSAYGRGWGDGPWVTRVIRRTGPVKGSTRLFRGWSGRGLEAGGSGRRLG